MVTVKATGAGEIIEIKIGPKAIDPDDPEMLEDMVLAAVNEALRSAQSLVAVEARRAWPMGGSACPGSRACAATPWSAGRVRPGARHNAPRALARRSTISSRS